MTDKTPLRSVATAEVRCPFCGRRNSASAGTCVACGRVLVPGTGRRVTGQTASGRPGCVTAFAVVQALGAVSGAASAIRTIPDSTAFAVFSIGVAILVFAIVIGLWRMQNWARRAILVLLPINTIGVVISLFTEGPSSQAPVRFLVIMSSIAVAFAAFVMYWFWSHRSAFH